MIQNKHLVAALAVLTVGMTAALAQGPADNMSFFV